MSAIDKPDPPAPPDAPRPRAPLPAWAPEMALGVAAFVLYAWELSQNGYGGGQYAAGVRSMGMSWKNFFYAALDPGGWITVDKPPLAFWLQSLAARAFGYSPSALLLPSAACGAGAVVLLAATVRRAWGQVAGLTAGVAFMFTPVVLAVSRSNNPDATLLLCLALAAYATQRAIAERRPGFMLLVGAACGLAFLTKLLVVGIVMPGLWLAYLVTGPSGRRRRVRDLAAAAAVFAGMAALWVLLVDHLPVASRPFVGGSSDGTALDLVLGYNGLGRLAGGQPLGPGGHAAGGGLGASALAGIDPFGGRPGIGRLFNAGMGDQVMWLVVFAGAAGGAGLALAIRRRRNDARTGSLVLWSGWAVAGYLVLAFARGIFHNYYVALLAPAIAALVGIGVELARGGGRAAAGLIAAAALGTAGLQVSLLGRVEAFEWLRLAVPIGLGAVCLLGVLRALGVALPRVTTGALALAAVGIGLVPSAIWAWSGTRHPQHEYFPAARPVESARRGLAADRGARARGPGGGELPRDWIGSAELAWLRSQRARARWILAVGSSIQAKAAIIAGDSVMPMGGFVGSAPAMTPAKLADLVAAGDLRFVQAVAGFGGGLDVVQAVRKLCTVVDASAWGRSGASSIYDCRGKAALLRAASPHQLTVPP